MTVVQNQNKKMLFSTIQHTRFIMINLVSRYNRFTLE